ncbi:cell cycle checkpoint protein RAD17-like [Oppia nitens]|uniref:cell cycle checkpoint protein RAD17-like n=1 Tax=Oppia nitens TaxID=1686743 RepID=UPI0023D98576|nr:cell cycle checkpoint protein RAD17-like [Oppia nitens]
MSRKVSQNWSDIWIQPSFDSPINETKQLSRKRQINEEVSCNDNSDDRLILDSIVTKDSKDLALSTQKCRQLMDWFRSQFKDKTCLSKFLLLNGPTGTGKTTSVKVLAKEFNVEVIEYKPYSQHLETVLDEALTERRDYGLQSMNQIDNFKHFIYQSVRYRDRLVIDEQTNRSTVWSNRLILIEDFPNIFHIKPETLHKELRLLNKRFGNSLVPIVFIISDTTNGQSDEYKLLPKQLQHDLRFITINFKPITDNSLQKILERTFGNKLSTNELKTIIGVSSGDVRNALNNMQLIYKHLNEDNKCDKNTKRLRKAKTDIKPTFDYVSRDSSLTVSHAIGKVLYAKRLDTKYNNKKTCELPTHLVAYDRRPPLSDCPESIADKLVVSSDVFNGWLHQNYIDLCDNLENAEKCIDWLCQSDSLFSGEQHFYNKTIFDSYQSVIAIRGLMFNISSDESDSQESVSGSTNIKQNKSHRKFKPFEKPQTFAVNRSIESLKQQISQLSENTVFSSINTLILDYMPYLSLLPQRLHSVDSHFKNILDKVVRFDHKESHFDEQQLCDSFSQSLNGNYINFSNNLQKSCNNCNDDQFVIEYEDSD